MKKLIFSFCAMAVVAVISCKSGGASSSDPKETLMNFFKAMSKKDLAGARKLATKESESMFSMMEMGMKMAESMKQDKADDEFKKFDDAKMEFGEAKIEGDKATVPVTNKEKNEEVMNFILKKEEGAWKVAFDKASVMQMAGEQMKNAGDEMDTDGMDTLSKEELQKGMQIADSLMKNLDPKKLEELKKAAEQLKQ